MCSSDLLKSGLDHEIAAVTLFLYHRSTSSHYKYIMLRARNDLINDYNNQLMVTHIHIWNFAIVEALDIELESGLSVLTGETGAGKSILLDALGLALGDRADSTVIRHGQSRAEISVTFDTSKATNAEAWLKEHELDSEHECIIRRTVNEKGPSKAFINGKPATVQQLRELAEMLVDLHGQHEHQSLLDESTHIKLLDAYANLEKTANRVKGMYTELIGTINEYDKRRTRIADAKKEEELIQSKKLAAIGTLASGVAHELNNPLNNIHISAQILAKEMGEDCTGVIEETVDDILSQTFRVKKIVGNLLDFARSKEPDFQKVNIVDIIKKTYADRKSTRLNSSHTDISRMPSSA